MRLRHRYGNDRASYFEFHSGDRKIRLLTPEKNWRCSLILSLLASRAHRLSAALKVELRRDPIEPPRHS